MSIEISIEYVSSLREQAGSSEERLAVADGTSADFLYWDLRSRYEFIPTPDSLAVEINDVIEDWHTVLQSGDRVKFLPLAMVR